METCSTARAISSPARPDIFQINRFAIAALPQRLAGKIDIHVPPPGRKRRPAAARPASWFSPADGYALRSYGYRKAPPRRSDRPFDRLFNRFRQRTGVTDTGGTAISHQIEAELVEVRRQAGMSQIIRHHFRAWRREAFTHGCGCRPRSTAFSPADRRPSARWGWRYWYRK